MEGSKTNEQKEQMKKEDVEILKKNFERFDTDGDGLLTVKEFSRLMRSMNENMSEAEIQDVMEELNPSGEGTLNFSGFLTLMSRRTKNIELEEELRKTFEIFDNDKEGFITFKKLRNIMNMVGENFTDADIYQMIHEADTDGDEKISFENFVAMMTSD